MHRPTLLRALGLGIALALVAAACGDDDDATSTSTVAAAGDGLPDLAGREVTIAVENAYIPFNYIDPATGEEAGWDYEAWDEICRLLNCVPKYIEQAFDTMIQAVADGQYDAAADGITITEERAQSVDFSEGYIQIQQRILVAADNTEITGADSITANTDLKVGTQIGTTNYDTAVGLWGADRVEGFDQFPFAIQGVIDGTIDAVIIDETAGLGYVGTKAEDVKLVGDGLSSDALGFIYPKGSDLVAPVNAALAEMAASGFLDAIAAKYFTDEFKNTCAECG